MVNIEGALASLQSVKQLKLWLESQTALFWTMNRGEWKKKIKHNAYKVCADIGSRGMSASKLKQNVLWWHGPDWLTEL